ncbi:MAG TPA: ABC transporter permease [Actinomycetota bacterium]|nr:ABC transporter permease [Actinomycetota bacterium]
MRNAFTIAAKDLRLRFRDKSIFILGFIAPFALATIITLAFGGDALGGERTFGLVDQDKSEISRAFAEGLKSRDLEEILITKEYADVEQVRRLIDKGDLSAAFVVPSGFNAAIQSGEKSHIQVLAHPERQISGEIAGAIALGFTSRINSTSLAVSTALAGEGPPSPGRVNALVDEAALIEPPIAVVERSAASSKELKPASYFGPAMAIFFLFFIIQFGARSILIERAQGTLSRLLSTPSSPGAIILGKVMSTFVIGVASLGTLVITTSLVFGAEFGDPLAVAVLCIVTVLAVMGITGFVVTFSKTDQQADSIGGVVVMALALLGGNFIPINQAPELFRRLADFTPNGIALKTFTELIAEGGGLLSILPALASILAFGVVTGGIAVFRARRMVLA